MPIFGPCRCRCGGDVQGCGCPGGLPRTLYATFSSTVNPTLYPPTTWVLSWTGDCNWHAPCGRAGSSSLYFSMDLYVILADGVTSANTTLYFYYPNTGCEGPPSGGGCASDSGGAAMTQTALTCTPFFLTYNVGCGGVMSVSYNRLVITA